MKIKEAIPNSLNILSKNKKVILKGLIGASKAWFLSKLLKEKRQHILWVCESSSQALENLYALKCFLLDKDILFFPALNALPFEPVIISAELLAKRIETLYLLSTIKRPVIIVTSIGALIKRLPPSSKLLADTEYIVSSEDIDVDNFLSWLTRTGYERSQIVQNRAEFSFRGSILDLFPPLYSDPLRLDLFGDSLEEIRIFDPRSQISKDTLKEAELLPASELIFPKEKEEINKIQDRFVDRARKFNWPAEKIRRYLDFLETQTIVEGFYSLLPVFYEKTQDIFDYIESSPLNTILAIDEPIFIEKKLQRLWEEIDLSYQDAKERQRVVSDIEELFLAPSYVFSRLENYQHLVITNLEELDRANKDSIFVDIKKIPSPKSIVTHSLDDDPLSHVEQRLKRWLEQGFKIVISCPNKRSIKRISEIIRLRNILPPTQYKTGNIEILEPNNLPSLTILQGNIESGFLAPGDSFLLLSYEDIIGKRYSVAEERKENRFSRLSFDRLKIGDFIVHKDHGIGIYKGLIQLEARGVKGEYILLEYRGGDKLYLPVDRLGLIEKYVAPDDKPPILSKLGTSSWRLTKKRIKKALLEIAHELVELYAQRKVRQRQSFSPPGTLFRQFEADFPYEETPDQAQAIEDVLRDLSSERPMDRLICGDVGFGKTEVALRAAFKVIEDGKQVAVLVPTTLLAQQHERTFKSRFKNFPITISALSRMKSRQEQKKILQDVSSGNIDIIIGTHRLLQSDVRFKDLGLLIIDEEHRFGVKHKERLKQLRKTIDCITLTATPIPRTLQLSLLGIRDLSVIETAPEKRLPVKTFLAELDKSIIKEAIKREIKRGGQVYFVHPKIKGLYKLANLVNELVPEARVAVAHGQMKPRELENIMIQFLNHEIDCLVCTTIIESGLDIPTVNTILISRADMFGLADLYQLRGRVGRSHTQAYCYLLTPPYSTMGENAKARLRAIVEQKDLGGGFELAMSDLKIRGAGNILGIAQSGHIAKVGYELYLDLLKEAIEELKGQEVQEELDPEINIAVAAYIPDSYIKDIELRLQAYRRLSKIENHQHSLEIAYEIEDRFGQMPQEVKNLFEIMAIKRRLRRLGVERLDHSIVKKGAQRLILAFNPNYLKEPKWLVNLITKKKDWKFLPDGRLIIPLYVGKTDEEILKAIKLTLDYLLQNSRLKG